MSSYLELLNEYRAKAEEAKRLENQRTKVMQECEPLKAVLENLASDLNSVEWEWRFDDVSKLLKASLDEIELPAAHDVYNHSSDQSPLDEYEDEILIFYHELTPEWVVYVTLEEVGLLWFYVSSVRMEQSESKELSD